MEGSAVASVEQGMRDRNVRVVVSCVDTKGTREAAVLKYGKAIGSAGDANQLQSRLCEIRLTNCEERGKYRSHSVSIRQSDEGGGGKAQRTKGRAPRSVAALRLTSSVAGARARPRSSASQSISQSTENNVRRPSTISLNPK
jgi:hypothetical protein